MDRTERLAAEFLQLIGHEAPIYEPDGNVPPDFLLSDGTAVEVRRLGQIHVDAGGQVQGLENADIGLWRTMIDLVNGYQTSVPVERSIGVFYNFRRPIPPRRIIARELKQAFDDFLAGGLDFERPVTLPCGIRLRFVEYGKWMGTPFRHAGHMDEQSGGWVMARFATALAHALLEKDKKIQAYKAKYGRWWLVLFDHVSWGTDENDRRQLQVAGPFGHTFDRVIIVNPRDLEDYFDL